MRWFHREPSLPAPPAVETRLREAHEAQEHAEHVRERVTTQVGFLQGLRTRWHEVHRENHLAELFREEWRRIS